MNKLIFLPFLSKMPNTGLLLPRIGLGLMFALVHGRTKMFGGTSTWEAVGAAATHLIGLPQQGIIPMSLGFMAATTEFVGGIFLLVGFLSRPTALLLAFTMFVAFLTHAIPDGFNKFISQPFSGAWPFELMFVFLGLALLGPGKFSVDAFLTKKP